MTKKKPIRISVLFIEIANYGVKRRNPIRISVYKIPTTFELYSHHTEESMLDISFNVLCALFGAHSQYFVRCFFCLFI